jgi:hypothetical protein
MCCVYYMRIIRNGMEKKAPPSKNECAMQSLFTRLQFVTTADFNGGRSCGLLFLLCLGKNKRFCYIRY